MAGAKGTISNIALKDIHVRFKNRPIELTEAVLATRRKTPAALGNVQKLREGGLELECEDDRESFTESLSAMKAAFEERGAEVTLKKALNPLRRSRMWRKTTI